MRRYEIIERSPRSMPPMRTRLVDVRGNVTKVCITILAVMISTPVAAQWLDHPTPGLPRTADGKPNLAAPAPRTQDGKPDLSGHWGMNAGAYFSNVAADFKSLERSSRGRTRW